MSKHFFKDKVVWVTGASSGIGEGLVRELAIQGAKIILSARNESKLVGLQQALGLSKENSLVLPLDLIDIASFKSKAEEVISYFGKIDVLINNAGLSYRGLVNETDLTVYRQLMEVNYFGTIALTKAVLPHMIAQKSGSIAVTSSIAGKVGTQIRSAYCGAKHALQGFFDCLRMEVYKQNITVTIVCPGYVKTDITRNALTADGSNYAIMDNAIENGMTVEKCSKKYLNAIANKKQEVIISEGKEIFAPLLKRISPTLLTKVLKKMPVK